MQIATEERVTDHIEVDEITAQGLLDALVDPVRRSIVRQLFASDTDIACGHFDINVSRSTGTHHFKVLRQAGVIRQYYVGTSKMNTLRRADLESVAPGLIEAIMAMPETARRPAGADSGRH
ncbi:ArsR/SmtB family transcription factor [Amycolatopsis australiensis]|uniref:DNA-binding transcriptional regulator, ArsR family n=1 Tax=Amycolatopsis australiensis TaxID=546364 RepID=A0A1K1S3I9_9PSEU|nr:helix-turn-helix transcriptional regulator [Amycolatopsis australiensis]SFW78652.1 DNA-binding transcriptional regulator, ArsR family [Amycolatopsis australiensis]